nr:efflux transporter outer membrane subunit [uncultured Sphingorhabdus sp.]
MKTCVAFAAAVLLSGCASIADGPVASSVSVPPTFVYAPQQESRDALDALLPDEDPAFQALVAAVENEAPDLQAALARVEAARASLRAAGAARAPNIQAEGSAGYARGSENNITNLPPGTIIDPANGSFSLGINASWDLDLFGRLRASQRAAGLRLDAADTDALAVRLTIVSDIARAVIDYRTAQSKLRIVEDDLAEAQALTRLTDIRSRAGITPGFDVVRAQGLEAAARSQRGPAEAELAVALGRLVTLTARDGVSVIAAFDTPAEQGLNELPSVGLPSTLLRHRPDIVAAERRLAAANAEIAAAAASRFPQISINAALGLAALALGDLFSADSLTASLGSLVAGPLLDFGRVEAQIDVREADAKEAFALYRRAVFTGIGEGESALGTLQANRNRLSALQTQLAIESDSVRLATARYRMGLSDFLGVIDAQRQLNLTRRALAEATGAVKRAEVEIYRSFGG